MDTHPPHWRPPTTKGRRNANPQGREAPVSHPHWHNCQQEMHKVNISQMETKIRTQGGPQHPSGCPMRDSPAPSAQPWMRSRWRRHHLPTQHMPSPQSSHTWIKWLLPSVNLELDKTSTRDAELYELKVTKLKFKKIKVKG